MRISLVRRIQLFLLCAVLGIGCHQLFNFVIRLLDEAHYARQRLEVANQLGSLRLHLEQQLNSTFYVSRGLEMLVAGLTADGTQLGDHWRSIRLWAAEASADIPYIINIGLSERYILKFVYPQDNNRAAIGLDYRTLPGQWQAVERAVTTRKPVVAGPLQLVQGGVGIICRIPLFKNRLTGGGDDFIGVVSMVIDYEHLLDRVGLKEAENSLNIAIKGKNGLGEAGELFYGQLSVFEKDGVQQVIEFVGGEWVIAAKPASGWSAESPYSRNLTVLGYVVSFAGVVMLYLAILGVRHRAMEAQQFTRELEARVDERTAQLQRAKDQAERANNAKSEFLAVVTHELRTPLNSIIGLTDLLNSMELGEQQRQYLLKVSTSAGLLLELINNILSYAKMESGKDELNVVTFSLDGMLNKVSDLFTVTADNKGLAFSVERLPDTPDLVAGDEAKIMQVLVNLCGNALKFTKRGTIHLTIEKLAAQVNGQDLYRFVVNDTGIGIDPKNQASLFKPFSQVDSSRARKYQGTGLGLSICKSFVDKMHGKVGVLSASGEGSQFWFEIPLQVMPEGSLLQAASSPSDTVSIIQQVKTQLAGSTLILAEDNEFNQTLAVALLNKVDINVKVAKNGLEVLSLLESQTVHGVLMDIQMPEMDGVTAAVKIRQQPVYKDLPIIALTANAMDEDKQHVLAVGMNGFVAKPIKPEVLYSALLRCIDRQQSFSRAAYSSS